MEETRRKPRLLQLLNRMATQTFEMDAQSESLSTSSQSELPAWLVRQSTEAGISKGASETGRIKLAVVDLKPAFWIQSGDPTLYVMALLDALRISRVAFVVDDVVKSRTFPPSLDEHGSLASEDVLARSVACKDSGIAWRFYPQSATTVGVAWCVDAEGREEIDYVLRHTAELAAFLFHPSLLALLFLQAMTLSMRQWIVAERCQVERAQIETGYHKYAGVATGQRTADVDFGTLSASVSGLAANIVTSEVCLHGLQDLARAILEDNRSFAHSSNAAAEADVRRAARYVGRHAAHWAGECAFLLREATAWQRKATIVVQGIFNLVAQRDQNTSIGLARASRTLAEESKRDSTSMKAIAAVTMFYLPGTFAAVRLTSTPLNDERGLHFRIAR